MRPFTFAPTRRAAVSLAACLLLAAASLSAGGCAPAADAPQDGTPAAGQAADPAPEAVEEMEGAFVADGLRYLVTSAEGAETPTVSVGTGTQPEGTAPGDGLADAALTNVVIPATVEHDGVTYAVTQVAPYAFQYTGLTSIELPEGIAKIGMGAFQFCRGLEAVEVPSTVTLIGKLAFFADGRLATIDFAEDAQLKEIGDGAFAIRKTSGSTDNDDLTATLTAVSLPASLKLLGAYAFYGQAALTDVTFEGETLNEISPYAFGYCTSLERFDVPTLTSSIERIGRYAFGYDTALKTVTFQGGVTGTQTTQAGNEFIGCTGVETVIYYDKKWNAGNYGANAGPWSGTVYAPNADPNGNMATGAFMMGTEGFSESDVVQEYYTVRQYASLEDAQAGAEPTGWAVVADGTPLYQIVAASCDFLEGENFAAGAWALEGGVSVAAGIEDSLFMYPCDGKDLAFGALVVEGVLDAYSLPQVGASAARAGAFGATVRDASGAELAPGADYTLAVFDASGAAVDFADLAADGTYYTLTATGTGAYRGSASTTFSLVDDAVVWTRVAGEDALGTAKAASKATFENASVAAVPCDWALLASSDPDRLGDAFAAAGLAGALGADVLLTDPFELSQEASYEVNRVGAERVAVLGDAAAVSDAVLDAVSEMYVVEKSYRVPGATCADVADQMLALGATLGAAWGDALVVCAAGDLAGAATAAPWCYAQAAPLVWADAATGVSEAALGNAVALGFTRAVVLGDADADAAAAQLEQAGLEVVRVAGAIPAEVNAAFAQFALAEGAVLDGCAVAGSDDAALAHAAAGAALAGRAGSLVLFAEDAADVLDGAAGVSSVWVLGPESAVAQQTVDQLAAAHL